MTERQPARPTAELVGAAQHGDRQAVEDLFARYLPRVQQIVALRMGRKLRRFTGLEDVTQEVLLKAFRDLNRCANQSEASFRNWLARSVEHEVATTARRARSMKRGGGKDRVALLSSVFVGKEPTPSAAARLREREELLEAAILSLPGHHREVIILRALCEMSFEEIAVEKRFRSEATARKAFSRARAKLLEAIGEDAP